MARPRPLLYQVRQVKTPYQGKSWKATAYIDGKRKQHWFASEREAKTFAGDSNAELQAYGSQLSDLSPSDRADSQRALAILKGHPEVSLAELARLYAAQAAARSASKPLDQFLAEYETSILRRVKSGELKSGSHKVIKETFVKLKTEFGNRILSEISSTDIERWLDRMPVGMRTKKRHRAYALQIFNAARKQKLVSSNPVEDVGYKGRKNDAEEITVLTPEQLQRLFACADPEILPLYAIAAFAGVRWNEIEQLNWEDIKESEIVISARIAKIRSRRIIPIRPALAAFLTERGTGSVLPRIYPARRPSVRRLDFLRARAEKQAGLHPWPRNALRHSFISYALAIDHDENRIALESGNTPNVIHTNYRALVTREEAEKFWNIRSPTTAPAPASVAEDMPESKKEQHAAVTLLTEFLDVQAKHAVAPIAFRETQRDFKRYAAVIAAKSVEDIKVGTGEVFRDEKDLRTFCRWILRGAPGHKPTAPKA
jgi:integrase